MQTKLPTVMSVYVTPGWLHSKQCLFTPDWASSRTLRAQISWLSRCFRFDIFFFYSPPSSVVGAGRTGFGDEPEKTSTVLPPDPRCLLRGALHAHIVKGTVLCGFTPTRLRRGGACQFRPKRARAHRKHDKFTSK